MHRNARTSNSLLSRRVQRALLASAGGRRPCRPELQFDIVAKRDARRAQPDPRIVVDADGASFARDILRVRRGRECRARCHDPDILGADGHDRVRATVSLVRAEMVIASCTPHHSCDGAPSDLKKLRKPMNRRRRRSSAGHGFPGVPACIKRPSRMTIMRSDSESASAWSCVT